jgi:GTP cyclohydrolase I
MQESLTTQIHDYIASKMQCESVAVSIACKHTCCSHRGIKHGSTMTTNKFSGVFMEKDNLIREEFLHAIEVNGTKF